MRSSSAWASRPVQNDLRALGEGRGRRPGAASDVACVCVCVCVCANGTIGNASRAVCATSPGEVRGSGGTLLDHHQQPWSLA